MNFLGLGKKNKTKKDELNQTESKGYSLGPVQTLNLYTRLLADLITRGRKDNIVDKFEGTEVLGKREFYYSVNRIFTRNGIKKPYFLELPEYIDRGFISDIRNEITQTVMDFNEVNMMNEHVTVLSKTEGRNFQVDLSKGRMQGRFKLFARDYERLKKKAEKKTLEDELKSDKHTKDTKRKVGSYLYIKEAVEQEKASFFKTNIIIELIATSDEILDEADKKLKQMFFQLEIKGREVFIQTNNYMKTFSPMGNNKNTLIQKMNPKDVFADETLSSLTVPSHGIIGDDTGIYHGIDIMSRRYVTFDFIKWGGANNILLTAQTGQGKSNYAKMLYTFYQLDSRYGTVVFDYAGTEYTPLAKVIGANIISMSAASGRYVNTMVIGRLTGIKEIDDNLKSDAQEATIQVFNLLIDENEGMSNEKMSILSQAIKEVYADFGVTGEKETWKNSEGITFFHLYQKIKDFLHEGEGKNQRMRDWYGAEEIKNFVINLSPYFEEGEVYKHWFKEPLSIQELIDNQHIVFSFEMDKGSESMGSNKSLALRQLFASHITSLLAHYNVKQGKRTVLFLEELQRYLKQKYSGNIISKFVSGGRKLGMITYLITNAPNELLDLTDSDSEEIRQNTSNIMSGITTYLIGALHLMQMEGLIEEFNFENSRGILEQLANIAYDDGKGGGNNAGLKYCFYVRYRGQSGLLRMLSHPALDELPLYKTEDAYGEDGEKLGVKTVETTDEDVINEGLDKAQEKDKELKGRNASFNEYQKEKENSEKIWGNGRPNINTNDIRGGE